MIASLNGLTVIEARIELPRFGLWWADLSVDTDDSVSGPCTLTVAGTELLGALVSGHPMHGRLEARIVGGAGKLGASLPAKAYRRVLPRTVLGDVLREAGESLSNASTGAMLDVEIPFWLRSSGHASKALSEMAERLGLDWRAVPDGSIWVGSETWPETDLSWESLGEFPRERMVELAAEDGIVLPGTVVGGGRVSRVRVELKSAKARTKVWFE